MPRNIHKNDTEVFRVVVTTTVNGITIVQAFGVYHDLAAARGIVTRERRGTGWRRTATFSAVIQKSPVEWETVEAS